MIKNIVFGALLLATGLVNAAAINSFQGTYDTVNSRALFTFNIDTVDSATPSGIDNIYMDFDEFALWTPGWSLQDATTQNTTTHFYDQDEMFVNFDAITGAGVSIQFLFGGVNLTNFGTSSWDHEWGFNWGGVYGSTLNNNQFISNGGQSNWTAGTLGRTIDNNVPEPSILALIGLGLAGLGYSRRNKLRR